jgi:hypothetical protein
MDERDFYQGEVRPLIFEVYYQGSPMNLSDCTFGLEVRRTPDDPVYILKSDSNFDKSQAANGIVLVTLTAADLSEVGTFYGQLAVTDSGGLVRKSEPFMLIIKPAIVYPVYDLTINIQVVTTASDAVELDIS